MHNTKFTLDDILNMTHGEKDFFIDLHTEIEKQRREEEQIIANRGK